jgi:hypothetical protein
MQAGADCRTAWYHRRDFREVGGKIKRQGIATAIRGGVLEEKTDA